MDVPVAAGPNPYPDRGSTQIWVQRLPITCHRFRLDFHLDRPNNIVPVLPVQPTDEVLESRERRDTTQLLTIISSMNA